MAWPGCGRSARKNCACGRSRISAAPRSRSHTNQEGLKMTTNARQLALAACAAAAAFACAVPAARAADEQFFLLADYRVGPYGANGQSFYGGFIDYLNY